MKTTGLGQLAERRRKRLTRVVAAGLVAAAGVIVVYRWKSQPAEKPPVTPQALPANVNQQLSGYSFTRSDHGRQIFTVHAARTLAFEEGGRTTLQDVWVEVFGRSGGRHDVIRTQSCSYNRDTGELFAEGKVQIELNTPPGEVPGSNPDLPQNPIQSPPSSAGGGRVPIHMETSRMTFVPQGSLLASDAPVSFRMGQVSGTGKGLEYATRDDWVELKHDVVLEMQPKPGSRDTSPLRLSASRLRFEKWSGLVTLWGPVEITQQDRRVTAASGKVHLDAQSRVTATDLEGEVHAHGLFGENLIDGSAQLVHADFDPSSEEMRRVRAEGHVQGESRREEKIMRWSSDRLQLDFSGKPARPRDGSAEGNVHVASETAPRAFPAGSSEPSSASLQASRMELSAAALNFSFRTGGRVLGDASTVGPGRLVLTPYDPKSGERIVSADPFVMDFDARGRPSTVRGLSRAHIVFKPSLTALAGKPDATTFSNRMLAILDPLSANLRSVDQMGDFRFEQGEQRAFADHARYDAHTEIVTLTGHPRVQDEETRARADRILINTRDSTAEGVGHVQAAHVDKAGKGPDSKASDPTFVVADRMLASRDAEFVHYEGQVRLWRLEDVIESKTLDVYKAARRLRSGSQVLTSFMTSQAAVGGTQAKPRARGDSDVPVTIRADDLEYLEEGRRATYRGHVQLDTQNTTLRSDRLDVFFSATSPSAESQLERAVAIGNVTVTQPARRATGEQAEYWAKPGKILLTGGPPALYDTEKGFTTGRQLTFFLRDDTIFLDGGEESPTLSKHRLPQ